jgi:hypothetical protein
VDFWLADDIPLVRSYVLSPTERARPGSSAPAEEVLVAT